MVGRPPVPRPLRVVVGGHDFKFFTAQDAALREAGAALTYDVWAGHDERGGAGSEAALAEADILVAAWCLGVAVRYAAERRDDQRLIVQLHRFELETRFPGELDVDRVDVVVCPGPHLRDEAIARFGWPPERVCYLPNPVDVAAYDRPKAPEARFTLGLLGYDRRLKRLDLALSLLARLRAVDPRYRLKVRGQPGRGDGPYFAAQRERILTDPALRGAVDVEPFDPDVAGWLEGVGIILSLSDVESFHLALAEGMASRALPVIRQRPGARELWPACWVHDDLEGMVEAVLAADLASEGQRARAYVAEHYEQADVTAAWRQLCGLPGESVGPPR